MWVPVSLLPFSVLECFGPFHPPSSFSQAHLIDCLLKTSPCDYHELLGCKAQVMESNKEKHKEKALPKHFGLALKKLETLSTALKASQKLCESLQSTVNSQHFTITKLQAKNKPQMVSSAVQPAFKKSQSPTRFQLSIDKITANSCQVCPSLSLSLSPHPCPYTQKGGVKNRHVHVWIRDWNEFLRIRIGI